MGQEIQKMDKILEVLFENSEKSLKVREVSRYTKIPKSTIQRYLDYLRKSKIIDKENKLIVNSYTKFLKSQQIIKKIFNSGLVDYIQLKLNPSAIVLFGSARKGEYTKESDIDIFVETTTKINLDLSSFEAKIKHKIHLFREQDINNLPKELFNNVINGIKLVGYIKVK